ncbi:hypothetical protein SADUNF_Sadunf10G0091400 [Salix dunnii]|uniref:Uncharacterized protein n=1 Tax=Salix dunnii TaxID=1413687 RepID=A0A835JT34_9ROSI|nr:hypothetical protein SADUNF_Sadunf10G0091400 [Salix dunnii]
MLELGNLAQNKRGLQLKHMRKKIAPFLQAGQDAMARIRAELELPLHVTAKLVNVKFGSYKLGEAKS